MLLQVFLGMAFFVEGFLMIMHKKHEPFDALVHFLLGTLQWACAAFIFLQLWAPHSLWLSLGRAVFSLMQGMWLWQVRARDAGTLACCVCCGLWRHVAVTDEADRAGSLAPCRTNAQA